VNKPWDFRAAIDLTTNSSADQLFQAYQCKMDAPVLTDILAQTKIDWGAFAWCEEVRENIYPPLASATIVPSPGAVIELALESVIMMAAKPWNSTGGPIRDPSQGCLDTRTKVPWAVLLLLALAGISTLGMGAY
jgi:hypothetical protein